MNKNQKQIDVEYIEAIMNEAGMIQKDMAGITSTKVDGTTMYIRYESEYAIDGSSIRYLARNGIDIDFIGSGIRHKHLIQFFTTPTATEVRPF